MRSEVSSAQMIVWRLLSLFRLLLSLGRQKLRELKLLKAIQPRTAHANVQNVGSEVHGQSHDQSSALERQRLLEPHRNAAENMPREVRSQVVDSRATQQAEHPQVSKLFLLTSPFFLGESIIV